LTRLPGRFVIALVAALVAGCATSAPRTFRFQSNRAPADALACAIGFLHNQGFMRIERTGDGGGILALRKPEPHAGGSGEWWRVELSVSEAEGGTSVVTSIVASSPGADGPYGAAPAELESVAGLLSSRCMWPVGK
jgi:hypothetical protein